MPIPLSMAQAKVGLRQEMLAQLRALTPKERAEKSLAICCAGAALPDFHRAQAIALYAPLPTEPDIALLLEEAWAAKKRVVLPRADLSGTGLDWHVVTGWEEMVVGSFGVREPDPARCHQVDPRELNLVFVPGVAFDRTGQRLGRGGGFYDRFLSMVPQSLTSIGLMFACQQSDTIPVEAHDQPLQAVLTEEGLRRF